MEQFLKLIKETESHVFILPFLTHWQQAWIIHVWCVFFLFLCLYHYFPSDGMALPEFLFYLLNKHPISYLLLSFDIQIFSKLYHLTGFVGFSLEGSVSSLTSCLSLCCSILNFLNSPDALLSIFWFIVLSWRLMNMEIVARNISEFSIRPFLGNIILAGVWSCLNFSSIYSSLPTTVKTLQWFKRSFRHFEKKSLLINFHVHLAFVKYIKFRRVLQ